MAKSKVFKKTSAGAGEVSLNMVPMVDVAFLLILFFILTSQISNATFSAMQLAEPKHSMAKKTTSDKPDRVTVNVRCMAEISEKTQSALSLTAKEYSVNGTPFALEDTAGVAREIAARFASAKKEGIKEFFVDIRADKRVMYQYVEPVMKAAAEAQVPKMNITAMEGN